MDQTKQDDHKNTCLEHVKSLEDRLLNLEHELVECKRSAADNLKTVTFFNGILEQSLAGIYVLDNYVFSYVNKAFVDIFGYSSADEIIGKLNVNKLIAPECRDLVNENVRKRTAGKINEIRYTFTGLRKDGTRNIVEVHGRSLLIEGKRSVIGLILDMTDYRNISTLAFHDALTTLANRALFNDRLEQVMVRARRNKCNFSLMYIDLDGFKKVNDTLGHAAGDHVLQESAQRLIKLFRESDTVSRYGGDEFVVILTDTGDNNDIAQLSMKVIQAIEKPIHFSEHTISISASIGISIFPYDGDDSEILLRQADSAMYEAKKSGKNTYRFAGQDQRSVVK